MPTTAIVVSIEGEVGPLEIGMEGEVEPLQTSKGDGEIKVQGEVGINAKVLTVCPDHLQEVSEMLLVSFFFSHLYMYLYRYTSAGGCICRRGTVGKFFLHLKYLKSLLCKKERRSHLSLLLSFCRDDV